MIENTLQLLKNASYSLPLLDESKVNDILLSVADAIESNKESLLKANAADLARMDKDNPLYDRLLLTAERLEGIASDMRSVAFMSTTIRKS